MGDLIRTSMGGGNSPFVSLSFWYNSLLSPSILDCTGLFYAGHNLPSFEDNDYPSLQIYDNGNRGIGISCGNPRGQEAAKIEQYEGGVDGDHGPIGEAGGTAIIDDVSLGYIYASYNSTGPSNPGSTAFGALSYDFFQSALPQDGFTYWTGWGMYMGLNHKSSATSGDWDTFALQAEGQLSAMSSSNPAKSMFAAATQAVRAYADSISGQPGTFNHGESAVLDTHKGVVYETLKPSQVTFWNSNNNVCAPYGSWNHAAICIDTGHAGPYPDAPFFDQTNNVWVYSSLSAADLKRAKIVVNGANAMSSTAPFQEGFSADIGYTSAYNMDFSTIPVGIPWMHNARALVGQPPYDFAVRLYDLQVWCGTYIDWTNPTNYSKVVTINGSTGTPAPLSAATAAFGTPTIKMHGDHLHFPTNLGTGGAFTKEGTISDFTPTPSY